MGVVVLLGPSTAGKSSTVRRIQQRCGSRCLTIDTDARISAPQPFQGYLYNIFLTLSQGEDVGPATGYIEEKERALLLELSSLAQPCLIAAGPLIPAREPEWTIFKESVRPTCFYLKLTAEEMYDGLKERRHRQHMRGLSQWAGFGSWDKNLGTRFNAATGTWDELSREESIPLIEQHLSQLAPVYEGSCARHRALSAVSLKSNRTMQQDLDDVIMHYLGIGESAETAQPYAVATPQIA